ncbi:MAG: rhamnogalacturonan acetylesterase [Opitutaceae bacterium]|nr:rhamnogalacturonan acetylesterase [Opitutaceae bacterium]
MNTSRFVLRRTCPALLVAALLAGLVPFSAHAQRAEDKPSPPEAPVRVELKFDFGRGPARPGFTRVPAGTLYADELGYGFDFGSKSVDLERAVTTNGSLFFFSAKVPEGNYRITATLGDSKGESRVTIRTEAARLMIADLATKPGQTVTRTFTANVRRPQLPAPPPNAPGASIVHMFLAGEAESRTWDDRLTIEFNGARPCLQSLEIVKDDTAPTLFVAGDSTVGDPHRGGPGGNWPTQLCQFLKPTIALCNAAEGGETSKSFITGARFDKVLSQMKPGDFLLVQFGHNDSKPQWPQSYTEPATTFKAYLGVYLAETRRRGATLVLVTPMERRANGDTVGAWARAMREFAAENKVPLVDQWTASKQLWTAMAGDVGEAFTDQTHLSGYGGYLLARLMAANIRKNVPALASFIVDDFVEMPPARPAEPPAYLKQSSGPKPTTPVP